MSDNEQEFVVLLRQLNKHFAPVVCIIKKTGRTERELTCIKSKKKHIVKIDFDDPDMQQNFDVLRQHLEEHQ